ncbi:response regulator [Anaerolineales bacterium HSG6]|nr:response regulator [Anaerolineales bacterium HSG6]MDM8530370.1 response regulator [Anaerolineales bacterium HSG25]
MSGASSSNSDDQEKIRLLIVDDIPETRENLRKLLFFESDIDVVGAATNGEEGIQMAVELQPDIILMDINMPGVDGITASERITQQVPFAQIIMMSVQGESDYLRRSMLAGAREFLIKPFSSDELVSSIRRVYQLGATRRQALPTIQIPPDAETADTSVPQEHGKIITVFSAKGGVGCSSIAVNLAVALQQNAAAKVVVVDANLQFGDIGVLLNLYASRTIVDLADNADDLDDELINDVLIVHSSGIKALLAPTRPEEADNISPSFTVEVLEHLKTSFDIIIVDTSSVLDEYVLSVLDIADKIVVVTTPEIPAIKDAKLFFEITEALEYERDRIMFVLNKEDKRINIRAEDIEANIKYRIEGRLPLDERVATTAVNQGIPFVLSSRSSRLSQEAITLSTHLMKTFNPSISDIEPPAKSGFFG